MRAKCLEFIYLYCYTSLLRPPLKFIYKRVYLQNQIIWQRIIRQDASSENSNSPCELFPEQTPAVIGKTIAPLLAHPHHPHLVSSARCTHVKMKSKTDVHVYSDFTPHSRSGSNLIESCEAERANALINSAGSSCHQRWCRLLSSDVTTSQELIINCMHAGIQNPARRRHANKSELIGFGRGSPRPLSVTEKLLPEMNT